MTYKLRDLAERCFWTFVAALLGAPGAAWLFDIEVWKTAATAGVTVATNAVLVIARQRLAVLPDPGAAVRDETVTYLRGEANRRRRERKAA